MVARGRHRGLPLRSHIGHFSAPHWGAFPGIYRREPGGFLSDEGAAAEGAEAVAMETFVTPAAGGL